MYLSYVLLIMRGCIALNLSAREAEKNKRIKHRETNNKKIQVLQLF